MKKYAAMLLAGALLLASGCTSMLERSYTSSVTHQDYYSVGEDSSVLRAETYQGLVNSILYFVSDHSAQGTIRLYNYTGDVEADLANACDEVRLEDPLGAFVIRSLTYSYTRILTYYEVDLHIAYSRSTQEVGAIRQVTGISGLRQELNRLISDRRENTVLLASYFSGDAQLIEELFILAWYDNPALFQSPNGYLDYDYSITLYPEAGTRRIIEISVPWSSRPDGSDSVKGLENSASALLEANPSAGEAYTAEELAAIVRSVSGPLDPEGSNLVQAALNGEPVSSLGLLLTMEYLCQQCGIEASMVIGTESPDALWLIVSTDAGYRHLLPESLYPDADGVALYTDEALAQLGYAWPDGLHPVCTDSDGTGE